MNAELGAPANDEQRLVTLSEQLLQAQSELAQMRNGAQGECAPGPAFTPVAALRDVHGEDAWVSRDETWAAAFARDEPMASQLSLDAQGRIGMLSLSKRPELLTLPTSLVRCTALQRLRLFYCPRIESLPSSLGACRALQALHLIGCASLTSLPDSLC